MLVYLCLFSVAIAVYINTLGHKFVFDGKWLAIPRLPLPAKLPSALLHELLTILDAASVISNLDLRPSTPVLSLLEHDYWGRPLNVLGSHLSYRPLTACFDGQTAVYLTAVDTGLDVPSELPA